MSKHFHSAVTAGQAADLAFAGLPPPAADQVHVLRGLVYTQLVTGRMTISSNAATDTELLGFNLGATGEISLPPGAVGLSEDGQPNELARSLPGEQLIWDTVSSQTADLDVWVDTIPATR